MASVTLILLSILIILVGLADDNGSVLDALANGSPGYPAIGWGKFLLGAVGVTLPLFALQNDERWSWRYVVLIVVMMVVTNYRGVEKFSQFVTSQR